MSTNTLGRWMDDIDDIDDMDDVDGMDDDDEEGKEKAYYRLSSTIPLIIS